MKFEVADDPASGLVIIFDESGRALTGAIHIGEATRRLGNIKGAVVAWPKDVVTAGGVGDPVDAKKNIMQLRSQASAIRGQGEVIAIKDIGNLFGDMEVIPKGTKGRVLHDDIHAMGMKHDEGECRVAFELNGNLVEALVVIGKDVKKVPVTASRVKAEGEFNVGDRVSYPGGNWPHFEAFEGTIIDLEDHPALEGISEAQTSATVQVDAPDNEALHGKTPKLWTTEITRVGSRHTAMLNMGDRVKDSQTGEEGEIVTVDFNVAAGGERPNKPVGYEVDLGGGNFKFYAEGFAQDYFKGEPSASQLVMASRKTSGKFKIGDRVEAADGRVGVVKGVTEGNPSVYAFTQDDGSETWELENNLVRAGSKRQANFTKGDTVSLKDNPDTRFVVVNVEADGSVQVQQQSDVAVSGSEDFVTLSPESLQPVMSSKRNAQSELNIGDIVEDSRNPDEGRGEVINDNYMDTYVQVEFSTPDGSIIETYPFDQAKTDLRRVASRQQAQGDLNIGDQVRTWDGVEGKLIEMLPDDSDGRKLALFESPGYGGAFQVYLDSVTKIAAMRSRALDEIENQMIDVWNGLDFNEQISLKGISTSQLFDEVRKAHMSGTPIEQAMHELIEQNKFSREASYEDDPAERELANKISMEYYGKPFDQLEDDGEEQDMIMLEVGKQLSGIASRKTASKKKTAEVLMVGDKVQEPGGDRVGEVVDVKNNGNFVQVNYTAPGDLGEGIASQTEIYLSMTSPSVDELVKVG